MVLKVIVELNKCLVIWLMLLDLFIDMVISGCVVYFFFMVSVVVSKVSMFCGDCGIIVIFGRLVFRFCMWCR